MCILNDFQVYSVSLIFELHSSGIHPTWFPTLFPKSTCQLGLKSTKYPRWNFLLDLLAGFPKTFCTSLDILTEEAGVLRWTFHVFVGHKTIIISYCLIYIFYIGQNAARLSKLKMLGANLDFLGANRVFARRITVGSGGGVSGGKFWHLNLKIVH